MNVWVAHMRIALSYNNYYCQQLKYVTMRTHRLLCVSSSAERALAQPPKYMGRKYDLYQHHSHPSQKCKYHNP